MKKCVAVFKTRKFSLKKGDNVKVVAGDDKGKTGVILDVIKNKNSVTVSGVAIVKRANKKNDTNNDNFTFKEGLINASNVVKIEQPVGKKKI